jgi:2-polyprenyl-3-methyl-5-hydroxy-6-metoxy-1,4-benzoquinol methylase
VLGEGVVSHGTLLDVATPPGSADVATTLDVLEHVPPADHAAFAGRIADILRPNGLWVIKVPSVEGLYYRASDLAARVVPPIGATFMRRLWQTDYEFPHAVYFSRRSLDAWLGRHGFAIVDYRYIGRALAYAMVPAVYIINGIERLRRRSDALVVIARRA